MRHFDLCVIGSGSGNSIIDENFDDLKVALIDKGERFGGTCLNTGCIPTKMFVYPATLGLRRTGRQGRRQPGRGEGRLAGYPRSDLRPDRSDQRGG